MRRIMSHLHQGLAWLVMVGWVAELYLIGTALFGATSTELHRGLGRALAALVLLLLVVALAGGLGRRLIGLSALLLILTVAQGLLPSARAETPWLAALHPVNALLLMGVTAAIGRTPRAAAQVRPLVASLASTLVALMLIGGLVLLATAGAPARTAAAKRATAEAVEPARDVSVGATEMAFGPAMIEVTAGQPVKRTLEDDGAAPHVLDQADPANAYTLTAGRLWSLVAMMIGLSGVVIGGLALAPSGRIGTGNGGRGASVALVAGLIGAAIGGLVVAAAEGGPGTGYGIVGGFVALVVGLIAMFLGGVALARSRQTRLTG